MPITGNYLLLLLLLLLGGLLLLPVDAKPLLFTLTWPPAHARQYTGIGWYRRLGVTPIQRVNLLPFSREAVQGRNPHSNISTSSMDQPPWLLSHWLPGSYTLPTPVRPGRQAMTRDDPRFDGENSGAVARGEPLPADMVRRFHERNAAGRWLAPSIIRRLRDRSQMEALRRAYQSIWDAVIPFTPIYHPIEYFNKGSAFHQQVAVFLEQQLRREGGIVPTDDRPYPREAFERVLTEITEGPDRFRLLCLDMNAAERLNTPAFVAAVAEPPPRADRNHLPSTLFSITFCVHPIVALRRTQPLHLPFQRHDLLYTVCPPEPDWPRNVVTPPGLLVRCEADELWLYRTIDDGLTAPFADEEQLQRERAAQEEL